MSGKDEKMVEILEGLIKVSKRQQESIECLTNICKNSVNKIDKLEKKINKLKQANVKY